MRYPIFPRKEQKAIKVENYREVTNAELYNDMERRMEDMITLLYELEFAVNNDFDDTKLAQGRIDMRVCINFIEELALRDK